VELDRAISAAGDLLLGSACHGCSRPWWGICPRCRIAVLSHGCYQTKPDPCPAGFPITVTTAPYDPIMQQLIRAHKERGALGLTPFLAGRLVAAIDVLLGSAPRYPDTFLLVPVPSSSAAIRDRGFDSTLAMSRHAARTLKPRMRIRARRLLRQARPVRDQAGLSADERAANLRGALRVVGKQLGPPVILIDDVVTTGSSLSEAARALRSTGHRVLGAASIAATRRSAGRSTGSAR